MFRCEVCGHQLDPKGKTTVQLVNAWVRGTTRTVFAIEDRTYRYRHEVCHSKPQEEFQESLFG